MTLLYDPQSKMRNTTCMHEPSLLTAHIDFGEDSAPPGAWVTLLICEGIEEVIDRVSLEMKEMEAPNAC